MSLFRFWVLCYSVNSLLEGNSPSGGGRNPFHLALQWPAESISLCILQEAVLICGKCLFSTSSVWIDLQHPVLHYWASPMKASDGVFGLEQRHFCGLTSPFLNLETDACSQLIICDSYSFFSFYVVWRICLNEVYLFCWFGEYPLHPSKKTIIGILFIAAHNGLVSNVHGIFLSWLK